MLETQQETIIATRNAVIVRDNAQQSTSVSSTQSSKWTQIPKRKPKPKRVAVVGQRGTGSWGAADVWVPDGGGYQGGDAGDAGDSGAAGGSTWICNATFNEGLITTSHFRTLQKYGIMLRKNDPYMMKGYDIVGPKWAKLVGKNNFATSKCIFAES